MALTYSDKEVERFHPICEKSLNKALEMLGVSDKYSVRHHDYTGTLEMDFVIRNRETQKTLCVIEVKRTPSAVKSSRYQYQAMSYIQQTPPALIERPYYLLTNIEYSCLFKFSAQKPNVHQQLITPGLVHNVDFKDINNEDELVGKTAEHYKSLLRTVINDSGTYCQSLDETVSLLANAKDDRPTWNSQFARVAYEYIRGAFAGVERNGELRNIREYDQRVNSLRRAFESIDFKGIFGLDSHDYADTPKLPASTLNGIHQFGKDNIDADEMVTALHQIISREHESGGEVPTDIELTRLMTVVAKRFVPEIEGCVCDPAAGSGNLLSCLSEYYPNIMASQIKANDKNPLLLQLLTMRLGLKFPQSIVPENAPQISARNIVELPKEYFKDMNLVLVNPPMMAGIACVARKNEIYGRIALLGGRPSTNVGQSPLEAAFIELITHLLPEGTVVVALLPKTHLTALGNEAVELRRFLLRDFGLQLIFNYPGKGLFARVAKDTVMVVGRVREKADKITIVNSLDAVADMDLSLVKEVLSDGRNGVEGLERFDKNYQEMLDAVASGWTANDSISIEIVNFTDEHYNTNPRLCRLEAYSDNISRGQVGNTGLSDLLYISSSKEIFDAMSKTDKQRLGAGMRNARLDSIEAGSGDSAFFDRTRFSERKVSKVVAEYIARKEKKGKQKRNTKSKQDILNILEAEARHSCAANSVLLPRDLRSYGKVYRCSRQTFVSTNFFIIDNLDETDSRLLASWMSTIFYQLSCERFGKNQEGTRKMERGELLRTHIPCLDALTDEEKQRILTDGAFESFIEFKNPKVRNVDEVWAQVIFGNNAAAMIAKAIDLLERKATNRDR